MKTKKIVVLGGRTIYCYETASLDVDPQCGFSELCPQELPVPGALEIVKELNHQAARAGLRIASKDAHPYDAPWVATATKPQLTKISGFKDLDLHWNRHCVPGTKGFEFLPGLDSEAYAFVAYKGIEPSKHPYGACYHDLANTESTGLIEFLMMNQIKNVIVGGLATSFCVKNTVVQLCASGYFRVFVNLAACRDITGVNTDEAITEMESAGAIIVQNLKGKK